MKESDNNAELGIHERFVQQARRQGDTIAVEDSAGRTSYSTLLSQSLIVANGLKSRGLLPEEPVIVVTDRTFRTIANLLGVLAAGGCYVPIDPDDPPDRMRHIVEVTRARHMIGARAQLDPIRTRLNSSQQSIQFMTSEEWLELFTKGSNASSSAPLSGSDFPLAPGGRKLAYILFTSGSTGLPKGVEVEHRSVVNLLDAVRELFRFDASDRFLAVSKIGFDISVAELFLPLITGGTVVMRSRELLMQPKILAKEIRELGISVFQTGPSVWSILLAEVPDFPKLRVAITTGEAISKPLAKRLAAIGSHVWNLYGPTEATVWATGQPITATHSDSTSSPPTSSFPIGQPLKNMTVKVMDEKGSPVPAGTLGELWIGGEGLARGYCHRASLTAERFVQFAETGERFYRTGDIVSLDPNGTLQYYGRNDDQLKVHGVRIEPLEVESAILKHASVTQAAVTWFDSSSDSRSLVAAVVPRAGQKVTAEILHHHLEALLIPAMIPSRFLMCEELPRTPSGKIDRNAIRSLLKTSAVVTSVSTKQSDLSTTERELIRIWEKTLRVPNVTRDQHFFTIGGDSLSAVTMLLEAESVFDISLPIRTIFEKPTVQQLAAHIDRMQTKVEDLSNESFVYQLSPQGRGAPVFFCGVDLKIARQGVWTVDCPLYSISLWAQGRGFVEANSVEELAKSNVASIREIQSRGPYRLAGYSFGALVALEIAHQLKSAGETVELLFLLDPAEPRKFSSRSAHSPDLHSSESSRPTAKPLPTRGLQDSSTSGNRSQKTAPGGSSSVWQSIWQWISYYRVHLYGQHRNPVSTLLLPKNRWPAFWYASKRLTKSYVPAQYTGPVMTVFSSTPPNHDLWRAWLPPSADIQILNVNPDEVFSASICPLWIHPLKSQLESKSESAKSTS